MPTARRRTVALVAVGVTCLAGALVLAVDVVGVRTSTSTPESGITYSTTTAMGGGGSPWLAAALATVGLVLVTVEIVVRRRGRPA